MGSGFRSSDCGVRNAELSTFDWNIGSGFGSEPEDVAVGILELHFPGPRFVSRFLMDGDTGGTEFSEEGIVFEADPNPSGTGTGDCLREHDGVIIP